MTTPGFNQEHQLFRQEVRRFIDKEIRPYVESWEEKGRTPREVWKKCGEQGYLGIHYPEKLGGMGADFIYSLIFHEEIGGCGSLGVALGIAVQTAMSTPALAKYGTPDQISKHLVPAINGDMVTSIAVSEPGFGSNVADIKTRAELRGQVYLLNGSKTFITNGTQADFLTLLARTSDSPGYKGLSLLIVPTHLKGIDRSKALKKTCYPSSDTAEIFFSNVEVPCENLIGVEGRGFIYQMEQFQYERLIGAAIVLGSMKRSYELTQSYIREREVFGKPLSQSQVTRHKMAQICAEITTLDALMQHCITLVQTGQDMTRDVSVLKLMAGQFSERVLSECVQIHGGYGLMSEYEVARYYRDAKLHSIGGGTNEVMKEIIAKMEDATPAR